MRTLRLLLLVLCVAGLLALEVPRELSVPDEGSARERVAALWSETRPILLADAAEPLTDAAVVARGAPLIEVWEDLEGNIAASGDDGETGAVLKLLHDFYGRPESTPERRTSIRNNLRANFGQRLQLVDRRVTR